MEKYILLLYRLVPLRRLSRCLRKSQNDGGTEVDHSDDVSIPHSHKPDFCHEMGKFQALE